MAKLVARVGYRVQGAQVGKAAMRVVMAVMEVSVVLAATAVMAPAVMAGLLSASSLLLAQHPRAAATAIAVGQAVQVVQAQAMRV